MVEREQAAYLPMSTGIAVALVDHRVTFVSRGAPAIHAEGSSSKTSPDRRPHAVAAVGAISFISVETSPTIWLAA